MEASYDLFLLLSDALLPPLILSRVLPISILWLRSVLDLAVVP